MLTLNRDLVAQVEAQRSETEAALKALRRRNEILTVEHAAMKRELTSHDAMQTAASAAAQTDAIRDHAAMVHPDKNNTTTTITAATTTLLLLHT